MLTAGLERRRSRASFQKTLEKICTRLSESPTASGLWKDRFFGKVDEVTVEAISLWVAGSFARGASDCGDLDLVLDYRIKQGGNVGGRRAAQALFKSLPDVRVYGGTPEKNESGVAFPEAVLVWQGKEFNWRNAISGIDENPLAERFSRSTDRIPFRTEQLAVEVGDLEKITSMEANGTISWTFIPVTDVEMAQPLSDEELNLERLQKYNAGQKTLKLLPYLLGYFRKYGGSPTPALRTDFESSEFGIGGAKVLLGRPYPCVRLLNEITIAQLILLPHLCARGPNGFWTIRRGSNHPLVMDAANISAYHLIDENAEPPIFNMSSPKDWSDSSLHCYAKGLDLFTTKRKAVGARLKLTSCAR